MRKKLSRDQKFTLGLGIFVTMAAITSTVFHSCNPKHEDIQKPSASTAPKPKNCIGALYDAGVYGDVKNFVNSHSGELKKKLTTMEGDTLQVYVRVKTDTDGTLSYEGCTISCKGQGCSFSKNGLLDKDLEILISGKKVGPQPKDCEISIPVVIE